MSRYARLFAYDRWANHEVISALAKVTPPPRSVRLLAHIVAAEQLWFDRVMNRPQSVAVWPDWDVETSARRFAATAEEWQRFVERLTSEECEREFSYRNSKGESWVSSVEDVMMHVVMHGTYHRGQIAADMRASGLEPVYTDFIQAARSGVLPSGEGLGVIKAK